LFITLLARVTDPMVSVNRCLELPGCSGAGALAGAPPDFYWQSSQMGPQVLQSLTSVQKKPVAHWSPQSQLTVH
jgi:hypothetical protein